LFQIAHKFGQTPGPKLVFVVGHVFGKNDFLLREKKKKKKQKTDR